MIEKRGITRRNVLAGLGATAGLALFAPHGSNELKNGSIKLGLDFGSHDGTTSAAGFGAAISKFKPHVVCYESGFTSEEDARAFDNAFSSSRQLPQGLPPFAYTFHSELKRHNITRTYALDRLTRDQSKLSILLDEEKEREKAAVVAMCKGKPEEAIVHYRKMLSLSVKYQRARDASTKAILQTLRTRLIAHYPELKTEPEIRVLVRYGVMHHGSLKEFAQREGEFKSVVDYTAPYSLSLYEEVQSDAIRGKRISADDDAVAKHLVEFALWDHALSLGVSHSNSGTFAKTFARRFDFEQFKVLSKRMASLLPGASRPSHLVKVMPEVPDTRERIYDFLQQHKLLVD